MGLKYQIHTKLPTEQIAIIFRDKIQGRPSSVTGFMWSRKLAWSFATPQEEDGPFAEIDNIDRPAFRVIAHHRIAKRPMFTTEAQNA